MRKSSKAYGYRWGVMALSAVVHSAQADLQMFFLSELTLTTGGELEGAQGDNRPLAFTEKSLISVSTTRTTCGGLSSKRQCEVVCAAQCFTFRA